jgi:tetratricopeptide (TPR) repeat protein
MPPLPIKSIALATGLALSAPAPVLATVEKAMLRSQEGGSALMRGRYDQAVAAYDQALQEQDLPAPRKADIHNDRGVAKWRMARREEALADFDKAIELAPEHPMLYNNRGNVLLDLGRAEEAVAEFTRAISLAPGYGAAYNNRANANEELGRHEAAIRDYAKATELMPSNAAPYNGRGRTQGALNRPYAALRYLNRAVSLNAKYPAAYRNRAQVHIQLERYREAIADLERVIGQPPEDPELYLLRGRAYARERKQQLAYKDFSKAIELDAAGARAYAERGILHIEREDYEPALANLNQAVALDAKLASAVYNRALAYFKLYDLEHALADVNKAIELDPRYAAAYKLRGDIADVQARGRYARQSQQEAAWRRERMARELRQADPEDAAPEDRPEASPPAQSQPPTGGVVQNQPDPPAQGENARTEGNKTEGNRVETNKAETNKPEAGKTDAKLAKVLEDYRKALEIDPSLTDAREAIRKLGGALPDLPVSKLPPAADAAKGWELQALAGGRYAAGNTRYPRLRVPLEMYGPGTPEILEWTPLTQPLQGFGLLRYAAGDAVKADGAVTGRHEYVAIVDTYRDSVLSIEPFIAGDAKATWEWTRYRVVITDPEGIANTLELRKEPQNAPVARQEDDPSGFGRLFDDERPRRSSGASRRAPNLFDWLFR